MGMCSGALGMKQSLSGSLGSTYPIKSFEMLQIFSMSLRIQFWMVFTLHFALCHGTPVRVLVALGVHLAALCAGRLALWTPPSFVLLCREEETNVVLFLDVCLCLPRRYLSHAHLKLTLVKHNAAFEFSKCSLMCPVGH